MFQTYFRYISDIFQTLGLNLYCLKQHVKIRLLKMYLVVGKKLLNMVNPCFLRSATMLHLGHGY